MSFQAHFGASRLGNCVPITDLVAKCVNVVCLVAVATLLTSVSGVSLLRACGRSHNSFVLMEQRRNHCGFKNDSANRAFLVLAAVLAIIGLNVNDPITRLVACCGNRPILRIVAA